MRQKTEAPTQLDAEKGLRNPKSLADQPSSTLLDTNRNQLRRTKLAGEKDAKKLHVEHHGKGNLEIPMNDWAVKQKKMEVVEGCDVTHGSRALCCDIILYMYLFVFNQRT